MLKNAVIIALLLALIYLYYQNRKLNLAPKSRPQNTNATDSELEKQLVDLENEKDDLEGERDVAIRKKNEAEAETLAINNRLKLKSQEITHKDEEITRLKSEKNAQATALNKKISEWKEKYKDKSKLFDEEQLESKRLEEEREKWQTKATELEQERKNLIAELNKNEDLTDFEKWLNENPERKANLTEWDQVLGEIKNKKRDYHLAQSNWSSGWLKGNKEYWKVFQSWLDSELEEEEEESIE